MNLMQNNNLVISDYDEIAEIPGYLKIPLGRAEDIRNHKFGKLTPLYRTNANLKTTQAYWLCKCDCGNLTIARTSHLKSGNIKSCGSGKCMGKEINLVGKRFGKLTVISKEKNENNYAFWKCQCDCGNIAIVKSSMLLQGHTKSCGCLIKELNKQKIPNLIGKKYGRLTVISLTDKSNSDGAIWECKCDCGNTVYLTTHRLNSGNVKSCGCLKKELVSLNLTNKRFGKLIALEPTEERTTSGSIIWKCRCDCGKIHYAPAYSLNNGSIQSCGCTISKGEEKINKILLENNIIFTSQQKFKTCFFESSGWPAKFDFFINNNYLIEYDGIQHFQEGIRDSGWNTQETFEKRQEHDNIKTQWCKENNIPLIRIPYWHYNDLCLEDLLLETTQFRVV